MQIEAEKAEENRKKIFSLDTEEGIGEKNGKNIEGKNQEKKKEVKVDVNNFDINGFRKEYQLSETDFPDELLKKGYIECRGNLQILICKLFDQPDQK